MSSPLSGPSGPPRIEVANPSDGGFFHWLQISDAVDGNEVMMRAIANGVQCRPGERFFGESENVARIANQILTAGAVSSVATSAATTTMSR